MRAVLLVLFLALAAPAQAAWWLELHAVGPLLATGEPAYVVEQQEMGGATGRAFATGDACMAEGRQLALGMRASTVDVVCRDKGVPTAFQDTPAEWLNGRQPGPASGQPVVSFSPHTIPQWLLARDD